RIGKPRQPAIGARMAGLAMVLLSGGMDSMVVAGLAREAGYRLLALTIDYNQRHRIELEAAARIAERLGAERHIVLPLDLAAFGGPALTADIDVPKGGGADGATPVTSVTARHTNLPSLRRRRAHTTDPPALTHG